ncbi:helix-turn-helix domain-containing protein [Microbispora sp. GKU 823]|uniref:helix-turn-helix domain-containing protein n=1 Tax=Microbispora sp. GKU 823 TaxID=1652100 RepID=UPI001C4E1382|nr:helix-turn-helix domain-containing protein [Microbispora sp. GKU 823]
MARWQPETTQRLVVAAVDLFTEQGYDATTVAQIAERAGVTKSTFFRHFADKREVLVAGQETLSRLLAEGIAERPRTPARSRRSQPVSNAHPASWGRRTANSAPA